MNKLHSNQNFKKLEISDSFHNFRRGFPLLKHTTYLSICDKMILHEAVRKSIDEFLDHLANASASRVDHEVKVTTSKAKFAHMMGVHDSTVAAIRNVSDGINTIANAFPFRESSNVVLTRDAEHPNNIYPWLSLRRKKGLEIRLVDPDPDGGINVDRLIDNTDRNTAIITAACVTFAPGHRTELERLGAFCRKNNIFLMIDGVQSAGILHHDLEAENIDGFATSTSKGLLGLYGYGFLYTSKRWLERLEPAYLSRPAVHQGNDDHSVMGEFDYQLRDDAGRFEVGSFNLAGAYAADSSLDLLNNLSTTKIEKHVLRLSEMLNEGLRALGFSVAVPSYGLRKSHIVTVGALDAGGHGFSSDPKITPVSSRLKESGVIHTIRRGQLRFGLHGFNNDDDVGRVLDIVKTG
jgi:cysteine desulfurase / selenocysteine lyase